MKLYLSINVYQQRELIILLIHFLDGACNDYRELSDSWRKIGGSWDSTKCDKDIIDFSGSTWYRFVGSAGKRLPTSPNPKSLKGQSACGTHGTAFIQPAHPTVEDGVVSRKVCFVWSTNGGGCYMNKTIDVLACRESNGDVYHIYKLKPPTKCSYAYCAQGMQIKEVDMICLRNKK